MFKVLMKKILKISIIPIVTYMVYLVIKTIIRKSLKNNYEVREGRYTAIQFYRSNYYKYGDFLLFLSYFTVTNKNKLYYLTFKPKDFKQMHSIVGSRDFDSIIRKHGESIMSFSSEISMMIVIEDLYSYVSEFNPILIPIKKHKHVKIKNI